MIKTLQGLRILNTRPKEQALKLSQDIRKAGGIVIELPTLEIQATDNQWINSLPDLTTIDLAIFTSINAVSYCFNSLKKHNISWPSSIKVIAIGKGSAAALQNLNIHVSDVPQIPDSEHLLALKTIQSCKKQNILLFKGEGGRPLIIEHLTQKECALNIINVYRRVMPIIDHSFTQSIWRNNLVDIILLTSEQSLYHLFKLFDKEAHNWLIQKKWLIISERLAEIARAMKIQKINVCHPHEIVTKLYDYVNKD